MTQEEMNVEQLKAWSFAPAEFYWRDLITAEIRKWQAAPQYQNKELSERDKGFLEGIRVASAIAFNAAGRKEEDELDQD